MTGFLVGLACFVLHALVTLAWLRSCSGPAPIVRHAVSAVVTHAGGVAGAALLTLPFGYWPAAAVSGFLAVCWLFAFSAVYKSVSLRVLTELDRMPDGMLSLDVVTERFVRPEFEARVGVLVGMGCAEATGDGYRVTGKGNDTARRIEVVRRACGVGQGGLYGGADPDPGRVPA